MAKKKKKITTIEDLAIMVQKGFEEILETTAKKRKLTKDLIKLTQR